MKFRRYLSLLAVLVFCLPFAHAQGSTAPTQPVDPTAQAPATRPHGASAPKPEAHASGTGASTSSSSTKARPFMGTVVQRGSSYMLRAGELEYRLDEQGQAKEYVGRNVKITGSLDKPSNTIHVQAIENSPQL
jgi:hypothetical protein